MDVSVHLRVHKPFFIYISSMKTNIVNLIKILFTIIEFTQPPEIE